MPEREYQDWRRLYEQEPFGVERDNYHAAMITAMIHNVNSRVAKAPSDFVLMDEKTRRERSTHSFISQLSAMAKKE